LLIGGAPQAATLVGSGTARTEVRAVDSFQAIAQHGAIDVVVRQAAREGVQVRADDNLLPLVQTVIEERGGVRTLRIEFKRGESIQPRTPVVVTVDVVLLNALASSGSGDIAVEPLKTPALAVSLSGSAAASLRRLDTDRLGISIAGSSDVQLSGRATRLDLTVSGSGQVRASELAADDVKVSIAGSGDANVAANKTIGVSIAGSGTVECVGAAALVEHRVAGSGSVRQRQP
jgi:hypothetical protein